METCGGAASSCIGLGIVRFRGGEAGLLTRSAEEGVRGIFPRASKPKTIHTKFLRGFAVHGPCDQERMQSATSECRPHAF